MPTDHDTALALQRHLGECDVRHKDIIRRQEEGATDRARLEGKLDKLADGVEAMNAQLHRAKGGLAVLMVVGGGVAGVISWVTAKLTAPGLLR